MKKLTKAKKFAAIKDLFDNGKILYNPKGKKKLTTKPEKKPKGMTLKQLKQSAIDRGQLQWEPEKGKKYWTLGSKWRPILWQFQKPMADLDICFRTKALATQAAKAIRNLLKQLPHD